MADRNTGMRDGELGSLPVAASTKLEAGRYIAVNAAGNAVAAADAAGLKVVGRAEETVDNSSGSAGDLSILVRRKMAFWWDNSATNAVTIAHLHGIAIIYIEDDETVSSATGVNSVVAGRGLEVDPSLGVLIETP